MNPELDSVNGTFCDDEPCDERSLITASRRRCMLN
jgi:hypothetical protein